MKTQPQLERGISMKDEMVLAMERDESPKIMTRRQINPQPIVSSESPVKFPKVGCLYICPDMLPTSNDRKCVFAYCEEKGTTHYMGSAVFVEKHCRYPVGTRLYIKQKLVKIDGYVHYSTDKSPVLRSGHRVRWEWKPRVLGAMYMPKWAARRRALVTWVKVERLQDISEGDALLEGFRPFTSDSWRSPGDKVVQVTARDEFERLWGKINGVKSWNANLWVWAISFKRVEKAGAK